MVITFYPSPSYSRSLPLSGKSSSL